MKELRDRYEVALYYYKRYRGYCETLIDSPKEEFYKEGLDYWEDKVLSIRTQIEVKLIGG